LDLEARRPDEFDDNGEEMMAKRVIPPHLRDPDEAELGRVRNRK
jgi:hypothetical protein